ncbi:hypothetical protein T09_5721 [Trichinella sp. T9]|nr:hypothetical protein T09_5721 [Trichinella sp. T9]
MELGKIILRLIYGLPNHRYEGYKNLDHQSNSYSIVSAYCSISNLFSATPWLSKMLCMLCKLSARNNQSL